MDLSDYARGAEEGGSSRVVSVMSLKELPPTARRIAHRTRQYFLDRGWTPRSAKLAGCYVDKIIDQIVAVVPITTMLLIVIGVFFNRGPVHPGQLAYGLVLAISGLFFFIESLLIAVIPMGRMLGRELPKKLPLPAVLAITCIIGMLCTYAEVIMLQL
jgi:hypothetical protein